MHSPRFEDDRKLITSRGVGSRAIHLSPVVIERRYFPVATAAEALLVVHGAPRDRATEMMYPTPVNPAVAARRRVGLDARLGANGTTPRRTPRTHDTPTDKSAPHSLQRQVPAIRVMLALTPRDRTRCVTPRVLRAARAPSRTPALAQTWSLPEVEFTVSAGQDAPRWPGREPTGAAHEPPRAALSVDSPGTPEENVSIKLPRQEQRVSAGGVVERVGAVDWPPREDAALPSPGEPGMIRRWRCGRGFHSRTGSVYHREMAERVTPPQSPPRATPLLPLCSPRSRI